MNESYEKSRFRALDTLLPCCGRISSLNELVYDMACGFACCIISIYEPGSMQCRQFVRDIEKTLGCKVKLIKARY